MADIVISHTTEDRDRAEVIARSLSAQGLKVWMYRDILGQGGDRDEVTAKVRDATRVIALWSPAGCASQWVVEEAKAAARDHRLINVELQTGMTPRAFQSGLRIDLSGWGGQRSDPALQPFAEAIATIVTGRAKGAPPPKPERKSLFSFLGESKPARAERPAEREKPPRSMFDKPLEQAAAPAPKPEKIEKPVERVAQVKAPIVTPPVAEAAKPTPQPAPPKLVVVPPPAAPPVPPIAAPTPKPVVAVAPPPAPKPAPIEAKPTPPAKPVEAPAAAAPSAQPAAPLAPEIQVFETSKPRSKPTEEERKRAQAEADSHLSLGRAFAYGLTASVVLGLLFMAGRHYFNTRPMTIAASAVAPALVDEVIPPGFSSSPPVIQFIKELETQSTALSAVQFGSDEWLLAVANSDGTVRAFEATSGKFFQTYEASDKPLTDVAFDYQAKFMATTSADGSLYVFRLSDGSKKRIDIGKQPLRKVVWRPADSTLLATGGDSGVLEIRAPYAAVAPIKHTFDSLITSIAWREDGTVVVAGLKSGMIHFVDAASGKVTFSTQGHTGAVNALVFSPNGDAMASAGDDGVTKLWQANDGMSLAVIKSRPCTTEEQTSAKTCPNLDLTYSPDGSILMVSNQKGDVEGFKAETGERAFILRGHHAPVTGVAWSFYDHRLATVDAGGTAVFWTSPFEKK